MERLFSQFVTMVFFTHALEPQSNNSVMPQDDKIHYFEATFLTKKKLLGFCAKRCSGSTQESSRDLLCILCPVLPAIEGFYKYAFPEKRKIVYSARTKIYCNTNSYLYL